MDIQEIEEPKNRWAKPVGIGVIIVTVITCIASVSYSKTDIGEAAKHYKENREKATRLGLIFSSDEANRLYVVPDSENGASLVAEVLDVPRRNHWDNERKLSEDAVKQHWDVFEGALAKIEEASQRKYLLFKRNRSNPIAMTFPEYSDMKTWVKLLTQMADFAFTRNDPKSAKRYLADAAYLSSAVDSEGILISDLVRVASSIIVETELKKILQANIESPAWRDVAQSTLIKLDKPYDTKRVMQLEHWFGTSVVDMVMKDPSSLSSSIGAGPSTPATLRFAKYIPRFREANLSRIDEAYAAVVENLPKDPYDFAAISKAYQKMDEYSSRQGVSYTMLQIAAPVFSQSIVAMSREVAYRNVLLQSIAAVAQRADLEKGLPLTGRYRLDLDNAPLRTKRVNGMWMIYSIGPDQVDNGGADLKDMKGDWVLHLPKL